LVDDLNERLFFHFGETLNLSDLEKTMKDWNTPEVSETETGMEVTSYMPAELDRA